MQEQAAWALNALTDKNDACIDEMTNLEAPAKLLPLLNYPESWNWTPVVSTLQNLSGGPQYAKQALVAADAISVLLDILNFGRPNLQVIILEIPLDCCIQPIGRVAPSACCSGSNHSDFACFMPKATAQGATHTYMSANCHANIVLTLMLSYMKALRTPGESLFCCLMMNGGPSQVLSAGILGNLGSSGDQEFKQFFKDAGGIEKLQELQKSGSVAPTAVRRAAASALTDITTGHLPRCFSPQIAHEVCCCLLNQVKSSHAIQRKNTVCFPVPEAAKQSHHALRVCCRAPAPCQEEVKAAIPRHQAPQLQALVPGHARPAQRRAGVGHRAQESA